MSNPITKNAQSEVPTEILPKGAMALLRLTGKRPRTVRLKFFAGPVKISGPWQTDAVSVSGTCISRDTNHWVGSDGESNVTITETWDRPVAVASRYSKKSFATIYLGNLNELCPEDGAEISPKLLGVLWEAANIIAKPAEVRVETTTVSPGPFNVLAEEVVTYHQEVPLHLRGSRNDLPENPTVEKNAEYWQNVACAMSFDNGLREGREQREVEAIEAAERADDEASFVEKRKTWVCSSPTTGTETSDEMPGDHRGRQERTQLQRPLQGLHCAQVEALQQGGCEHLRPPPSLLDAHPPLPGGVHQRIG